MFFFQLKPYLKKKIPSKGLSGLHLFSQECYESGIYSIFKPFSSLVGTQHLCKGHLEWVMTLSRKGRLLKSITVSCTCCTTGLDQETAFFWPFGLWLAWRLVRTNWCGPFVIQPTTLLFVLSSIHTGSQTSGLKNLPRIYYQVMLLTKVCISNSDLESQYIIQSSFILKGISRLETP